MMTEQQLSQLRSEISLGSLYVHDYENSFGIDPNKVGDFFDTYIEMICDYYAESKGYDSFEDMRYECELTPDQIDLIYNSKEFWSFDNDETLYRTYCCFMDDPLPIE